MKKGWLWLLLPCLLGWGNIYYQPEQKEGFPYLDIGAGPLIPLPTVGVGYRTQSIHHGFDMAARFSSIILVDQFKASALYLYYPKPDLDEEFYIGLGGASFWVFPISKGHSSWGFSGEWVFGKQFRNARCLRRFWQIQTGFPSYFCQEFDGRHMFYIPLPIFSYGFIF